MQWRWRTIFYHIWGIKNYPLLHICSAFYCLRFEAPVIIFILHCFNEPAGRVRHTWVWTWLEAQDKYFCWREYLIIYSQQGWNITLYYFFFKFCDTTCVKAFKCCCQKSLILTICQVFHIKVSLEKHIAQKTHFLSYFLLVSFGHSESCLLEV